MDVIGSYSLKDKVAVVTGGMGLLGKQHCVALAEAGANVIICDLDQDAAEDFAATLPTWSTGIETDITNLGSVKALKINILKKYGRIDILVNNAAINDMVEKPISLKSSKGNSLNSSMFENYPLDLFKKVMDVNITGTFICSQVIGSYFAKCKQGNIINIASTYGVVAPDQSIYRTKDNKQKFYKSAAYPVTKGAVIAFTKFLAAYWGEKNVRVNSLSPGGVENGQDLEFIENYSKKTPLKRMAKPYEYKGALVFLASDASSYMTGANLIVDGGWTVW